MTNKRKKLVREYAITHGLTYQAAFNRLCSKAKAPPKFLRAVMDDGQIVSLPSEVQAGLYEVRAAWDEDVAEHGEEELLQVLNAPWKRLLLKPRTCWLEFDDGVRVPWSLGGEKHELPPDQEKEREMMLMILSSLSGREILGVKYPEFPPLPSVYSEH